MGTRPFYALAVDAIARLDGQRYRYQRQARNLGIGTIFGCVSPHSLAGVHPQTRPGWGMEPAPERKGPGGAGKQQGGKAEQIHATRYHVTLTEGGEISRERSR